jgi:Tol biopolymer transport system component
MFFTRFTRRQFMTATSALGVSVFSASQSSAQAPTRPTGRKGQTYPDQRKKHTDSQSGKTVWQMTQTHTSPDRMTETLYFTNRTVTRDSRWFLYVSDRANSPGRLDLFKMDLRTGESVQLTE